MSSFINQKGKSLPEGFKIHLIRNNEDLEKAIRFNAQIHGESVDEMVRDLCR